MKTRLLATLLLAAGIPAAAAPTDIVPQGSALYDAFARLAADGALGGDYGATDFLTDRLFTRAQLAHILAAHELDGTPAASDSDRAVQAYAVRELAPELALETGNRPAGTSAPHALSYGALGDVQGRARSGGDSRPDSGATGIYRVSGIAGVGRGFFTGSVSNWPEEYRRNFTNDRGPQGLSGIQEAALSVPGRKGFVLDIGRLPLQWGPAYSGALLLGDDAQPFDQLRVRFPFSLGRHLGRNYSFEQMASVYRDNGITNYFEARRISYQFSPRWSADFQEAFKSWASGSLWSTILPFYVQSTGRHHLFGGVIDPEYNYTMNLGASYAANADSRIYGQLFFDDFRSPFGTQFHDTSRKIAYLAGTTWRLAPGTSVTGEYSYADPTTYTYQNPLGTWQRDTHEIGLPEGPNSKTLYGRLEQKLGPRLTFIAEGRDRRRRDDSWPAPNSRYIGLTADYRLSPKSNASIGFDDYKQDPFPFAPGQPGYPTPAVSPFSEADPGSRIRITQWRADFRAFF